MTYAHRVFWNQEQCGILFVHRRPKKAGHIFRACGDGYAKTRDAALRTDGQRLYWLSIDNSFEPKAKLNALAIGREKPDVKTLMEGVREYQLSADDKKLLVRKDKEDDLYVFDAGDKTPDKLEESKVDLSRWTFSFDPCEQWRQMFVEAWRLERDYFYDPAMHGVDWKAVLERHLPLVAERRAKLAGYFAVVSLHGSPLFWHPD